MTSSMRRVKALWNIASEAELETATVGWWATWPPEPIRGAVVSDHTCYHFLFREGEGGEAASAIYPESLTPALSPLVRRPADVGIEQIRRYADIAAAELERPFDFADEVSQLRWALATADSYTEIGLELWRDLQPELLMVYIEGTDSVSHLFGHLFRADGLAGELAVQQQRYGRAVEEVYDFADEIVGRFMDVMDDDTTLVVLSDHGFKLGELHDDPTRTRDLRRVSERFHREQGILYLWGNSIRRHARIDRATQLDITPTLLTLLGLEPALDMPGRVLAEALESPPASRTLASYEDGEHSTCSGRKRCRGRPGDRQPTARPRLPRRRGRVADRRTQPRRTRLRGRPFRRGGGDLRPPDRGRARARPACTPASPAASAPWGGTTRRWLLSTGRSRSTRSMPRRTTTGRWFTNGAAILRPRSPTTNTPCATLRRTSRRGEP